MARKKQLPSQRKDAPTVAKARKMLKDGTIRGKPITEAQRGFLGAIVSKGRKKKK